MISQIRKISVGRNYPDGAIHYQVGKTMNLQGVPYEISEITKATEKEFQNVVAYHIFIRNEHGTVYWKTVSDLPVMVENDINFE